MAFVADAYYAAGKMLNGLLKQGNHLVTGLSTGAAFCAPGRRWLRPGRRCYTERVPKRSPQWSLADDDH